MRSFPADVARTAVPQASQFSVVRGLGIASTLILGLMLPVSVRAEGHYVPLEHLVVSGPPNPTMAESLAVRHFNREIERFTGRSLPVAWGPEPSGVPTLQIGTRATFGAAFDRCGWDRLGPTGLDADVASQSYLIDYRPHETAPVLSVVGFSSERTPRGSLGLGYALGDLLRRLDVRQGTWGFVVPTEPMVVVPAMPHRTHYIMNALGRVAGLSLECASEQEIEEYVDFLVDCRYSRVSFFQWAPLMLYPGNWEQERSANEQTHRAMRHYLQYARQRGLEAYHQLSPLEVNADLLPGAKRNDNELYRGTICWSSPENREFIRKVNRAEMEYFGPVDGYIVWFYDPGGCFCSLCKPNQAQTLFEQLTMVVELARSISPEARFQACLWPTWCFPEQKGFSREEVDGFVRRFLEKCRTQFGPGKLTILDTCEQPNSNLYREEVTSAGFPRSGFLYTVLGIAGEHAYPFAPFRFRYLDATLGQARRDGLVEANLHSFFSATNRPSVFAFAETCFNPTATGPGTIRAYASQMAKGEARESYVALLSDLDASAEQTDYAAREAALAQAEARWPRLAAERDFHDNRDWLQGYLLAQRYYLGLARATDEATFRQQLARFKEEVGTIPMYRDYMGQLSAGLVARLHLKQYWRGPAGDPSQVGLP